MERRNFIRGGCIALTVGLAGCTSSSDADTPDPETPTSELLPDTEDWPLDEENDQAAGIVGGNDGIQGRWDGPDGGRYTMEIMRFDEEESAEDVAADVYGDWLLNFSHGVFSFAVNGDDGDHARDLLAESPALDPDTIEANT